MFFPPDLGPRFMQAVKPVWESNRPDSVKLQLIWNLLTGLQSVVLGHVLVNRIGDRVFAGPFRGLRLIPDIMERPFSAALLGTQGWEMHGAIEEAVAKSYKQIVHVGCSYGYYSIGLAMRLPQATVYAFDPDPDSCAQCRKMALANGVEDRVMIAHEFTGEMFDRFANAETLVLMDSETSETELLDPFKYASLLKMDVIVAIHDALKTGLSTALPLRFADSHDVRVIPNSPFCFPLEKILGPDYSAGHFDNLIATWEGQARPTPYGVFNRKKKEQK